MRIVWTAEALDDLENILLYYHQQAGLATAEAVGARIVDQIVKLTDFPERIRASERVPGPRELVIARLPCIAFVRVLPEVVQVLNILHTARKFPE